MELQTLSNEECIAGIPFLTFRDWCVLDPLSKRETVGKNLAIFKLAA